MTYILSRVALNCRATVLTFFTSVAPIQELALNLSLMKSQAVLSSIVARIASPRSLHALLACKKHEKKCQKISTLFCLLGQLFMLRTYTFIIQNCLLSGSIFQRLT